MQLTDEQRKAIEWAIGMASQHNIHNSPLRALLAAHSAGAQGANVHTCALCGSTGDCKAKDPRLLNDCQGAWYRPAAQPMPQTDAARDAKRYQWLREQHEMQVTFDDSECVIVRSPAESAWTVFRPGRTTSLEPVGCFPGELDKAIDAEIERLDRAKGE